MVEDPDARSPDDPNGVVPSGPSAPSGVNVQRAMIVGALLVIVVVVISLPIYQRSVQAGWDARVEHTRGVLASLADAVEAYAEDQGAYPPPDSLEVDPDVGGPPPATSLVVHLDGDPANGGPDVAYHDLHGGAVLHLEFLDPWSRPYRYLLDEDAFEVRSTGDARDPDRVLKVRRPRRDRPVE